MCGHENLGEVAETTGQFSIKCSRCLFQEVLQLRLQPLPEPEHDAGGAA
jgi:hypothetical protein